MIPGLVLVYVFSGLAFAATAMPPDISNEDRALRLIAAGLKDRNPDTRTQAVESLSLAGPREPFLSQAEAALKDKDFEVRMAAIESMLDLKNPRTVPALERMLNDRIPEVSFAAAKALWLLHEPTGKEAMISLLNGETKAAAGFLSQQKREAFRMLHTPKTLFKFAVETGADFAPVPELDKGLSSLQGILSDPSVSGRAATALLLGSDNDTAVLNAVRGALADKDGSVRAAASHAIALRDDPALQNDLVPLLTDKKEAVRLRAAAGYLRLEWIRTLQSSSISEKDQKNPLGP